MDPGGHKLHVYCTGRGEPTVVVENGLGDFSFDWALVQARVSHFTRICTYDRSVMRGAIPARSHVRLRN